MRIPLPITLLLGSYSQIDPYMIDVVPLLMGAKSVAELAILFTSIMPLLAPVIKVFHNQPLERSVDGMGEYFSLIYNTSVHTLNLDDKCVSAMNCDLGSHLRDQYPRVVQFMKKLSDNDTDFWYSLGSNSRFFYEALLQGRNCSYRCDKLEKIKTFVKRLGQTDLNFRGYERNSVLSLTSTTTSTTTTTTPQPPPSPPPPTTPVPTPEPSPLPRSQSFFGTILDLLLA